MALCFGNIFKITYISKYPKILFAKFLHDFDQNEKNKNESHLIFDTPNIHYLTHLHLLHIVNAFAVSEGWYTFTTFLTFNIIVQQMRLCWVWTLSLGFKLIVICLHNLNNMLKTQRYLFIYPNSAKRKIHSYTLTKS